VQPTEPEAKDVQDSDNGIGCEPHQDVESDRQGVASLLHFFQVPSFLEPSLRLELGKSCDILRHVEDSFGSYFKG
jgi:hypothetical protein